MQLEFFLKAYLKQRPLFLSLIRARELELFTNVIRNSFARPGLTKLKLLQPILDVGCGDGFFMKILAFEAMQGGTLQEIVGLDLPGSRMEEARKLNIYKKLVEFDGVKMPFASESFNTIISNCVLEHVEKLPELLQEICRVLKPGGRFITSVMARPWEENLVGAMLMGNSYKNYMRRKQVHLNLLTRDEWRAAFKQAKLYVSLHPQLRQDHVGQEGYGGRGEIGYLSPNACRLIDVCHYLSIPNLISYKLFGCWVLTPGFPAYPVRWLSKILSEPVDPDKSGAIFFVLEKSRKVV